MKRKSFLIVALALVFVLGLALLDSPRIRWQQRGETDGDRTVIAYIRGEAYAVDTVFLEDAYSFYRQTPEPHDEAWVKEFLVANELLYREAVAQGLEAGPEEVDEYIASLRQALPGDPEGYAVFLDDLQERGLTEEEYWTVSREAIQKELSIEKLGEKLQADYIIQHPTDLAYHDYYLSVYRPQLFDKYRVEML